MDQSSIDLGILYVHGQRQCRCRQPATQQQLGHAFLGTSLKRFARQGHCYCSTHSPAVEAKVTCLLLPHFVPAVLLQYEVCRGQHQSSAIVWPGNTRPDRSSEHGLEPQGRRAHLTRERIDQLLLAHGKQAQQRLQATSIPDGSSVDCVLQGQISQHHCCKLCGDFIWVIAQESYERLDATTL